MTKREMFVAIANVAEVAANEEMMNFINHEIELLDNRKGKNSKGLTKTQKENEGIKELILATLAETKDKMTVSDLITTSALSEYSNQKISALLRQLVASGQVEKTMEKKKSFFSLANVSSSEEELTEEAEEELTEEA